MSQIPRPDGGKSLIKNTTTTTSRIPDGGTRTTTVTNVRELLPCSAAGSSVRAMSNSESANCQDCGAAPSARPSGIRPPRVTSLPQPSRPISLMSPPRAASTYIGAPSGNQPRRPPSQSQYGSLQHQIRKPPHLKYEKPKGCPGARAQQRTLQGGISAAARNQPQAGTSNRSEAVSRNEIEEQMNQTAAQKLFDMSGPQVKFVETRVNQELLNKSMIDPEEAVFAKGQHTQCVSKQPMIQTPVGLEPVLQQAYMEQRVERDSMGERIIKNLAVTDIDEATGRGTRLTLSEQHLNADYGLTSEGRDVVSIKETVSVTPSYTSTAKNVLHEVVKPKVDIDPEALAKLIEEENQDVENTLKMAPPDFVLQESKYSIKKRLQKLRLNSESLVLLEESVVNPTPTGDEVITETTPEAIANIMHTVESGVTPECAPDQVFHTLFEEKATEQSVVFSSIGPGPLQDVIIPQQLTTDMHKESMTHEMTELTNIYKNVTDANDWPPVDIFDTVMDDASKNPKKDVKTRPFKPIADEEMPWAEHELEPLVNIVGAEPSVVLDPVNVPDIESLEKLEKELAHGIEYIVDANPVQYMSRVQLRGTRPPLWFPGYMYALPEFLDVVKIARSADEVFLSCWKSCQPKIIPEHSVSILE